MIAQGSEEISIIVGVDNKDFEKTIRTLYDGFMNEGDVYKRQAMPRSTASGAETGSAPPRVLKNCFIFVPLS